MISDYNYGVVDARAVELIRKPTDVPVLVDSRFRLSEFTGFTAATPNEEEVENLLGRPDFFSGTIGNCRRRVEADDSAIARCSSHAAARA